VVKPDDLAAVLKTLSVHRVAHAAFSGDGTLRSVRFAELLGPDLYDCPGPSSVVVSREEYERLEQGLKVSDRDAHADEQPEQERRLDEAARSARPLSGLRADDPLFDGVEP
jgi:hypothetical protein